MVRAHPCSAILWLQMMTAVTQPSLSVSSVEINNFRSCHVSPSSGMSTTASRWDGVSKNYSPAYECFLPRFAASFHRRRHPHLHPFPRPLSLALSGSCPPSSCTLFFFIMWKILDGASPLGMVLVGNAQLAVHLFSAVDMCFLGALA